MIEITIPGEPVAQGRPRFSRKNGVVRTHDPVKSKRYKRMVQAYALQQKTVEPLNGPLVIEMDIYKEIPKSWSKVRQKKAAAGEILPAVKSDIDNYAKSVMDGLTGILYLDDKLVCDLILRKRYSYIPRVEVRIKEMRK